MSSVTAVESAAATSGVSPGVSRDFSGFFSDELQHRLNHGSGPNTAPGKSMVGQNVPSNSQQTDDPFWRARPDVIPIRIANGQGEEGGSPNRDGSAQPASSRTTQKATAASSSQAKGAPGDRLADGAVRLIRDYPGKITWSEPSSASRYEGHRPFLQWLRAENEPLPLTAKGFQQFMSSTDMNCYQWVILAALRGALIDRRTAIRYYDSFANSADETAVVKGLYGAHKPLQINIDFTPDGLGFKSVTGPGVDGAQKGDIITFSGKHHVMVVVGKDRQGHLLVASFPTVIYGDVADAAAPANTYLGTFEKFLQTNLDNWKYDGSRNTNYFDKDQILVGPPAFIF